MTISLSSLEIGLVVGLSILVLTLELATPSDYVFGYLYTGSILWVNARLNRRATLWVTILAVFLTLVNLWIPGLEPIKVSAVANRLIAALSLVVTGFLSEQIRRVRETITRQQEQEKVQQRLRQMQEDFASTLTHDLKTPLLGALETLEAWHKEKFGAVTPAQKKILSTICRSHQSSLHLVETLLDVYRNERLGLELKLESLNLATLVEEVVNSLTPLATNAQVYFCFNYGLSDFRQDLPIQGDRFQLQRVLTNLLINGVNHSRRDSRIEISLESGASYQIVRVIDNGSGITPQELPYLFERFYQSDSNRQARGTGLGLYLSRQIIVAHGGIIWAENRYPQRGAIFAVRLPTHPS